jgi:PKD repeat protein
MGCAKEKEKEQGVAQKCSPLSLNLNPVEYKSRTATINGGVAAPVKSIQWDWGDGTLEKHRFFPASHTYTAPGQYEVKVTAFGTVADCSEQKSAKVQIK